MMVTKGQARAFHDILMDDKAVAGMKGVVRVDVYDESGRKVDVQTIWEGYDVDDIMFNTSLNTAREIMAHVMAGNNAYKLAKVAFGNCGHNFDNIKQKVDPTPNDTELMAATLIKQSLSDSSVDDFTYTHNGSKKRIVYIEKDITQANISFGPNGDEFVVEVPITFNDYNLRNSANNDDETAPFVDDIVKYDLIASDGSLMKFRNIDSAGNIIDNGNFTEVIKTTNGGGDTVYRFKNGIGSDGNVDTTNGGYRPQELSEILLCTDIIGSGTQSDPYKKLASSRITSGLLVFPEGFGFTFHWSLSWNMI